MATAPSFSRIAATDDGRSLSFAEYGPPDGAPIVFCHSIPGSRVVPQHCVPLLHEHGLHMIVPERPGFGLSDFKPRRTIRDCAADIGALADALGWDSFRVMAASAGCVYALACGVELAERVERLSIMSGLTPDDYAGPLHSAVPGWARPVVQNVRPASSLLHRLLVFGLSKQPERALDSMRGQLGPHDAKVLERPDARRFIVDVTLEASHRGVRGMVYDAWLLNRAWGFDPGDLPASVPVTFWWGTADIATPLEHGRRLAGRIPHSTLNVVDDCGHFGVVFEHLEEIVAEVAA